MAGGWDTGFQSVAAIHADPDLAKERLRLVLGDGWQTRPVTCLAPNGRRSPNVRRVRVGGWQIFQADGDKDYLAEIFPRLEKHTSYWTKAIQVRRQNLTRRLHGHG